MTFEEQHRRYDQLRLRDLGRREMIVREKARQILRGEFETARGTEHIFHVQLQRRSPDAASYASIVVKLAPGLRESHPQNPDALLLVEEIVREQLDQILGHHA